MKSAQGNAIILDMFREYAGLAHIVGPLLSWLFYLNRGTWKSTILGVANTFSRLHTVLSGHKSAYTMHSLSYSVFLRLDMLLVEIYLTVVLLIGIDVAL